MALNTNSNPSMNESQRIIKDKHLPVPDLKNSLKLFLDSVKPILTPEEYQHTVTLVEDFSKPGGDAEKLYGLLQQRDRTLQEQSKVFDSRNSTHPDGSPYPNNHWLEFWWETYAYQADRGPLATLVNCFQSHFGFQPSPNGEGLRRAAWGIAGLIDFKQQILLDIVSPERAGNIVLCSAQYYRGYTTNRIPGVEVDTLRSYGYDKIDHICVERKGHWYVIEKVSNKSVEELILSLQKIKQDADGRERGPGVAAFTGVNRTKWANNRLKLLKSPHNKKVLDILESSLFHLILSEESFDFTKTMPQGDERNVTLDRFMEYGAYGTGENIWFDKCNTHIVFENGAMVSNLEHSHADAVVPARSYVYMDVFVHKNSKLDSETKKDRSLYVGFTKDEDYKENFASTKVYELKSNEKISENEYINNKGAVVKVNSEALKRLPPLSLDFRLDFVLDKADNENLVEAKRLMKDLINDHKITVMQFKDFGGETLMNKFGNMIDVNGKKASISTDSFMQMCLHLAHFVDQYSSRGNSMSHASEFVASGYETASTRSFFHGRTETIRTQSIHVQNFCKLYQQLRGGKFVGDETSVKREIRAEFINACNYHRQYLRTCMAGQGCDRVLFGLKMLALENKIPLHPFYLSKAYTYGGDFTLSTSQMPFPTEDAPGFGAYSQNAYGVCYRFTHKNSIVAIVTSRGHSCETKDAYRFAKRIKQSLRDIFKLLIETADSTSAKL